MKKSATAADRLHAPTTLPAGDLVAIEGGTEGKTREQREGAITVMQDVMAVRPDRQDD